MCQHKNLNGKNEGNFCTKTAVNGSIYCSAHKKWHLMNDNRVKCAYDKAGRKKDQQCTLWAMKDSTLCSIHLKMSQSPPKPTCNHTLEGSNPDKKKCKKPVVKGSDYCSTHRPKYEEVPAKVETEKKGCAHKKRGGKKGEPCQYNATGDSLYCTKHKKMRKEREEKVGMPYDEWVEAVASGKVIKKDSKPITPKENPGSDSEEESPEKNSGKEEEVEEKPIEKEQEKVEEKPIEKEQEKVEEKPAVIEETVVIEKKKPIPTKRSPSVRKPAVNKSVTFVEEKAIEKEKVEVVTEKVEVAVEKEKETVIEKVEVVTEKVEVAVEKEKVIEKVEVVIEKEKVTEKEVEITMKDLGVIEPIIVPVKPKPKGRAPTKNTKRPVAKLTPIA